MKISPVNSVHTKTNSSPANNTFKGLWNFGQDIITDTYFLSVVRHRNAYYHPFADETKDKVAKRVAAMTGSMTYHGGGDFEVETLVTNAKVSKTLSFTKEEFAKYKNFYGKNLPKKFKQIEQELKSLGLERYINRGLLYKIKCFLHYL